ncbi:MAG: hypothetical protein ACRDYC_10115 [Acidimicrobiales bacterium]
MREWRFKVCEGLVALKEIRSSLASLAGRLDYCSLLLPEAEAMVAQSAAIVNVANTIRSRSAARLAKGPSGSAPTDPKKKSRQDKQAADKTAELSGAGPSQGKSALETGQRLETQEGVSEAANQGDLSPEMLSAIAEAVEANPGAEKALLDLAASGASLAEVRAACAKAIKDADADPDETRRRIHSARSVRSWTDSGGVWHIRGEGLPEFGAAIDIAIASLADRLWQRGKAEAEANGDPDGPEATEAYRFDALVALVGAGYEAVSVAM